MSIADYVVWSLIIVLVVADLGAIILLIGAVVASRLAGIGKVLMALGLVAAFIGYCVLFPSRIGGAPRLPAPGPGEHVEQFDVAMHVRADGVVNVRETIDYDFGARPRAVFYRLLATNGALEGKGNGLHSVLARSVVPAPATVHTYRPNPTHGRQTLIAIRPPSGQPAWRGGGHRFVIDYELRHVTHDQGKVEIAPVASSWKPPIERFHATLTGDTRPSSATCEIGDDTGRKCETIQRTASAVELAQRAVPLRNGIVIRAGFPGVRHTISTVDELSQAVYLALVLAPLSAAFIWWITPSSSRPKRADPRFRVSNSSAARRHAVMSCEEDDAPDPPDIPDLPDPWPGLGGGDIGSGD